MAIGTKRETRNHALDGLRGLAALAVFCHHCWGHQLGGEHAPFPSSAPEWAAEELRLSVPLFFVLSGLLIYRGFLGELRRDGEIRLGRYVKRRAARILPAYYAAIAGVILLLWGSSIPGLGLPPAHDLPLFAIFAQNYDTHTYLTLDSPTWTLCVEVAFYAALPLLVWAFARAGSGLRAQAALVAFVFFGGIAWHAGCVLSDAKPVWDNLLPSWLPYFGAGMAVALWAEHRPAVRLSSRVSGVLVGAAAAIVVADGFYLATHFGLRTTTLWGEIPVTVGLGLLALVGLRGTGPGLSWMQARPLVGMGTISYGFYLWHLPILFFLRGLYPHGGVIPTFLLALPLAVAAGIASWKLVEEPVLQAAAARRRPTARPARSNAPYRPSTPRPASQASG